MKTGMNTMNVRLDLPKAKIPPENIPCFDGTKVREFLEDYDVFGMSHGWSDKQKLKAQLAYVEPKMTVSVTKTTQRLTIWVEVRQKMLEEYAKYDVLTTMQNLLEVRRSKYATLDQFLEDFERVARRAPFLDEAQKCHVLLTNFAEDERKSVVSRIAHYPLKWDEVVEMVRELPSVSNRKWSLEQMKAITSAREGNVEAAKGGNLKAEEILGLLVKLGSFEKLTLPAPATQALVGTEEGHTITRCPILEKELEEGIIKKNANGHVCDANWNKIDFRVKGGMRAVILEQARANKDKKKKVRVNVITFDGMLPPEIVARDDNPGRQNLNVSHISQKEVEEKKRENAQRELDQLIDGTKDLVKEGKGKEAAGKKRRVVLRSEAEEGISIDEVVKKLFEEIEITLSWKEAVTLVPKFREELKKMVERRNVEINRLKLFPQHVEKTPPGTKIRFGNMPCGYLNISVNDVKVRALVDSGAEMVLMSSATMRSCGLGIDRKVNHQLSNIVGFLPLKVTANHNGIVGATDLYRRQPLELGTARDNSKVRWGGDLRQLDEADPIPWFRKFELTLQLHYVKEHKHHAYLYSRSGGACQAWLDNLLSKYGVVAADLDTKISWDDLKAAWHKRFQVEPPEIKAMDKLMVFEQGTLPSVDWIAEYQRLTSVPDNQIGFKTIKHYLISRSCLALGNALTHIKDTLMTPTELFDKAAQIIVTNKEAKNLQRSSAPALCAHLHTYLSFYAPPTSPTDDEVAVGDILAYVTKVARECRNQQYDDNNALLLYVRIQVGQASCNALLDSDKLSQTFMQKAGLGTQVRRKANPTTIKLADGRTQQFIDHHIETVPVYFAPHACEPVTFDILDTDFDIILGTPWLASADHTVNFHRQTLTVRNAFGAEVSCTIPLPHPSIRCQVVTAKSFRATCAYEHPNEIGLCFLRTVTVADSSPTDLSLDLGVVQLLDEFADIFESPTGVVPDRPISHKIILKAGAVPPKGCIYRMSEEELTVLRAQLDDLLDKGWICPSSSPYGAPVLFVRKKNKDLRLCIDYRKLNAQTVKNAGPLPRIDDLLERLGDAKYFSKLDLKSGYHQISIRPNDRYKSAFKTRYGHFEWVVVPFRLTNAPTTFQATMTNEFRAMLDRFVLVYLDDILVYSRSLEDHLEHLRRVLETLRRAKYKANRDKCEFAQQELEYLGHFVTPEGISPLSDKIQAIQKWPDPRNVMDVRSFLGLAGYYQRFIKGYSKIAAHLTKLQCEDRPFDFGEDAWESFLALKAALLSAEVLCIYDPLLPTSVTTDASGYGIGAVLEQHDGVDWHPVEYFSKKVPVVHSIDDARKKELLAFVHALKPWRHFLLGRSQFRWVTNNNPLVFYKTQDTVNNTIARWMAFIDQFDFFSGHIPGKSNRFADALSRRPDHCTAVYSTFEIDKDLRDSFIRGYQADPEFCDK
ncbi:hypothetical protein CBR_g39335 [Chara braunii]|uniref:Reverse transcriptase domain-containing protein n=1 Tax=Chara braunii TaxID=69332 RepID=A0A388LRM4_CHABU|nr:hypothetical protein CBR_g39335 [Chara braunii]|eukprot:GBG84873.1 hypothetical protein CBR_g39335 [Chara braunii]